jgi:hypothetical protein
MRIPLKILRLLLKELKDLLQDTKNKIFNSHFAYLTKYLLFEVCRM